MNRKKNIIFLSIGILVIFIIAMALSLAASSFPEGFFLIPDYAFGGVGGERLQTSMAGFFGVIIIFALFAVVYLIYRAATFKNAKDQNKSD